jgi:cobalt-zinc-cadmium resistance protein CzcA
VAQEVKLPTGYRVAWGGQFENQQRAAARLILVVPMSLGFIFLILFSTFGSVRQALLVLSNIPFAMVGGIVACGPPVSTCRCRPRSASSPAGHRRAQRRGAGELLQPAACRRAVAAGLRHPGRAMRRLRPVLMTAAITAFGLIPLLFASGPGSEIQRPLAIVVIGGLITATALTLILLPILYLRFAHPKPDAALVRLEMNHV